MEDWLSLAAVGAGPDADRAAGPAAGDAAGAEAAPGAAPAILVTVAIVEGSVPREPGARMLVDAARQWGTVGGGHLELRGAEVARAMLAAGDTRRLERFPLGPSLGQCCGGVVHLAFERVDRGCLAALAARSREDCWRLVLLDAAPASVSANPAANPEADVVENVANGTLATVPARAVFDATGRLLHAEPQGRAAHGAWPDFDRTLGTHVVQDSQDRRWLVDAMLAPRAHLMLFGAGHVGAAIVRALADLPCRVTWVDERDDLFPSNLPHNVVAEATDTPEALAETAPPGTSFLVMTHSHALDQRLAETILRRSGHDWFGLIGSATKRTQFERRLRERGIAQDRLGAMVCPIGVPGIEGKLPAVIAVGVAAQLLMVWEGMAQDRTQHERI